MSKQLTKEYMEVFVGGISAIINDFKNSNIYTNKDVKIIKK